MSAQVVLLGLLAAVVAPVCAAQNPPVDVHELGVALAARGVPAGLMVPVEAQEATDEYPPPSVQAAARARALFATGELPAVLSRFNASSGSLRATNENGVVRVRSLEEPHDVRAALERRVYVEEADDVPVMEAIFTRVLGLLAGREPQGLVGSIVTRPGDEPACPPARRVRLGGEDSVIGTLDNIVRQVPGLVWRLTYDPAAPLESLRIGIICADGSWMGADVNF
jgi:hypothetical protein